MTRLRLVARRTVVIAGTLATMSGCRDVRGDDLASTYGAAPRAPAASRATGDVAPADSVMRERTWIEMRGVDLRVLERAVVHVRRLHGEMLSAHPGVAPILDSTSSFRIRITGATVAIDATDLAALMNGWVFAYKGSPLRDLEVGTAGSQITLRGVMHKGVDLRFEQRADVSLMSDGSVRLHPTSTRILGVDGLALMRALGLHLSSLLDLSGSRGARVVGDDIYLDATKILPPPAIEGRLASIRVEGKALVQEFVRLADDSVFGTAVRPDSTVPNLVYFRGGALRFGRLTMDDTDLLIVDRDMSDPLDLYLERYAKQLIAGASRTLPNLGLRVEFPDYSDLGSATVRAK